MWWLKGFWALPLPFFPAPEVSVALEDLAFIERSGAGLRKVTEGIGMIDLEMAVDFLAK